MRLRIQNLNNVHLKHRIGHLCGVNDKEGVRYRERQYYSYIILFRLRLEVALCHTKSQMGRYIQAFYVIIIFTWAA